LRGRWWLCAKLDDDRSRGLEGIASGGFSYGHRFTHDEPVEIPDARAYRDTSSPSTPTRRAHRYMGIGRPRRLAADRPGPVLDEVVYLVEKPDVPRGGSTQSS
jgi:glycyl-tRNA synthetase beta subunit